ncbi:MAG: YwiC-like family protein [Acidobacteriia bacterium]|nr:YwiC-like family protein [Terriglobia bacterium]
MRANNQSAATSSSVRVLEFPRRTPPSTQLLVPREHGTWGLWLLPLISGGVVGYWSGPGVAAKPALWFCLAAACAFLIYQPLESLLGFSLLKIRTQRQQRVAILWVIVLTAVAAISVLQLIQLHRAMVLLFGLVACACFGLRTLLGRSRSFRVPKQLIGAMGLSSTAAGAYYAMTGQVDTTSLALWLASWLFAAGQIEYVQLRLHAAQARSRRRKARASVGVGFLHLLMLGAAVAGGLAGVAPLWLGIAFIPAVARLGIWIFRSWRPLSVHILGFSELFQGLLFNGLLTAAFLVHF